MEDQENKEKKLPPPIRVSEPVMEWIYGEQERLRRATGKRPSASRLIEALIWYKSNQGNNPTEITSIIKRDVVKDANDSGQLRESPSIQADIDYGRIEHIIRSAIQEESVATLNESLRALGDRIESELAAIARAKEADRERNRNRGAGRKKTPAKKRIAS